MVSPAYHLAVFGLLTVRASLAAYLEIRRDPYHEGLLGLVDSILKGVSLLGECTCDICSALGERIHDQ